MEVSKLDDFELSDRKKSILFCAIDNYIKLASPITSLMVHETELTDISTATIRNELNTLEAMGFLKQLHTSSGRVPTTKGYRFFVAEVLKNTKINVAGLHDVKDKLFSRTSNLSEIVSGIAKVVSDKTNYPAVVMFDGFENLSIQSIKVVYMLSHQVLVLIETNAGAISNMIEAEGDITKQDCDNASKIFSDIFYGKSVSFLTQNVEEFSDSIKKSMKNYEEVFKLVLNVLCAYQNNSNSNVSNKGLIKMLENKESSDSAKNILGVLDDKETLSDVFSTKEDGVTVQFGVDTNVRALSECAVIKTPLVLDGKKIASVGVIGPERIDYASIASVLKYVSDELEKNFKRGK